MVDLDCTAKMVSPDMPKKSPKFSNKLQVSIPSAFRAGDLSSAPSPECSAPALQALELTFRFVSTVLSDPRPYANRREWKRRLESLTTNQIQLVAILCEEEEEEGEMRGTAPISDLSLSNGVLARDGSCAEVWKVPGATPVVSRTSEASLLPRLATWPKSEDIAQKIMYSIECEMRGCPYTLGLGEPNLVGKPNLEYDLVCKPSELHSLKRNPYDHVENYENQTLYTTSQILESWIYTAQQLLKRIAERIEERDLEKASSDCWLLERIWKLLADIEDLHLLMDPDDFLRLKKQLSIKSSPESEPFCFRSRGLVEITKSSKDLKHKVPYLLGVEVDPKGGPRVQEAVMKLYREKASDGDGHGKFGSEGEPATVEFRSTDSLSQIFMEPTYYPSLDAAKTFLGDFWDHQHGTYASNRSGRARK
ncbi:Nematode resistance protein-like HSPRO2 [Vitis vinifera]|uniref:Nematode resistance protein-like HSPRO2 n=1 Tax=Vitis vinifera TaxID=29760 RepID=A0A438D5N1_VITVI|nr:Nematode resistance protein-like HSPRO2 [Vitis vinifera]